MRRQSTMQPPSQRAEPAKGLRTPWPTRDVPLLIDNVPGAWSLHSVFLCGEQAYAQLVPFKRRNDETINRVVVPVECVSVKPLETVARKP